MSHRRLDEYSIQELEEQIERLKRPFKHHCEYVCRSAITEWKFDEEIGDHVCSGCGITSEQDIMYHKAHHAMHSERGY